MSARSLADSNQAIKAAHVPTAQLELEAMTTSEVVEEIWMSRGVTSYHAPWRRSGTRGVLLVNSDMRELMARMTGRKSDRSWRERPSNLAK